MDRPRGPNYVRPRNAALDGFFGFCTVIAFLGATAAIIIAAIALHNLHELRETGVTFGVDGANGADGGSGVTQYASYYHVGQQNLTGTTTVAAGQPLQLEQLVTKTTGITATTGVVAPFTDPGTVFTLAAAGVWQVSYHANHVGNDAFSLFAGPTGGMVDVPYAHAGGNTGTAPSDITVLVVTNTTNWQVAVVCAVGVSTPCDTGVSAGTTVSSVQNIVIEKIA